MIKNGSFSCKPRYYISFSEKKQVALWEQTLADIYIYEEYLSDDIVKYLNDYRKSMEMMELYRAESPLNENQQNALENFYEITNPTFKNVDGAMCAKVVKANAQ